MRDAEAATLGQPAVVLLDSRACRWWPENQKLPPAAEMTGSDFAAFTGLAGGTTLTQLFPGDYTFAAYAKGYEGKVFTVHGQAGQTVDAGDIVLTPATGRIEVIPEHANNGYRYDILLQPNRPGNTIVAKWGVQGATWVFEKPPLRPCINFVQVPNGGRGIHVDVNFDSGERQVVRVDVGDLRPLPSKR